MKCVPLVLYLTSLLDSALGSLPAPVNLSVSSVNFHHVLRWEPGPGTPPGTQYRILSLKGEDKRKLSNSKTTSVKLALNHLRQTYTLTVQASHKGTRSPESPTVSFTPFRDTIIGPPLLSLAGCGNCIQINISLPKADSSSKIKNRDIHAFYSPRYRVLWKKRGGEVESPYDTVNRSFTLHNLQNDTEYCVQVHTTTRDNKNTKPSAWECTSTSNLEPSRVVRSLSAPFNLSIESFNFRHVLSWDAGPGTPPGTQYTVFRLGEKQPEELATSMTTSVTLRLKYPNEIHYLIVRASYNHSVPQDSRRYVFSPLEKTEIGPPKLSLAGCGNCIQINISLPEPDRDSGLEDEDIYSLIFPKYRILWKKHGGEEKPQVKDTENRSYTLTNLEKGVEYCIRVEARNNQRTHIEPSDWECTFTSVLEPSRGPLIVGTSAGLLICVGIGIMVSMFSLYYTGFICNLKETLPRGLIAALRSQGYTLTPEETTSDPISISPARKSKNPLQPASWGTNAAEEEEDEEEEEQEHVYIDRAAELSSGQSSREDSGDVSRNTMPTPAEDSGTVEEPEFEVIHEGIDEDEAEAEGAEVSFIPETGGQGHVTGEQEEDKEEEKEETMCDSSGDVNLFSVTLAALDACEEEEEQNVRDSVTDDLELLLLPTDCQTESHDQTAVVPAREHFTETGYEGTRAETLSGYVKTCVTQREDTEEEDEEDEEEEDFSGYMKHT